MTESFSYHTSRLLPSRRFTLICNFSSSSATETIVRPSHAIKIIKSLLARLVLIEKMLIFFSEYKYLVADDTIFDFILVSYIDIGTNT
jgi:hypothetical protein